MNAHLEIGKVVLSDESPHAIALHKVQVLCTHSGRLKEVVVVNGRQAHLQSIRFKVILFFSIIRFSLIDSFYSRLTSYASKQYVGGAAVNSTVIMRAFGLSEIFVKAETKRDAIALPMEMFVHDSKTVAFVVVLGKSRPAHYPHLNVCFPAEAPIRSELVCCVRE